MAQQNFKARILTASAGSGKTYSLAREYIYNTLRDQPGQEGMRFNPNVYRTILAVTFTNKATAEMKGRILNQINNLATGAECEFLGDLIEMTSLPEAVLRERAMQVRSAILHDYSRFSILTNDTFFQRIVRSFAKELSIDMDYAIELDTAPVVQKSVDMLIDQANSDEQLRKWLEDFAEENVESGSAWNIKGAILSLKRELFKEHSKDTVGRQIDKQQLHELVTSYITLSEEYIEKLRGLARDAIKMITDAGCTHKTFSGSFTSYLEKISNIATDTTAPSKTFISHCSDQPRDWFTKAAKPTAAQLDLAACLQPMITEIVERFDHAKYLIKSVDLLRQNYRSFALLHDLYTKVSELCREQNTMLLAQTKHTIAKFVREPSDAPFIYEKVGVRFDTFMIDEFQDTSLMEWQNFLPLLHNAISQSEDVAVLIVGDIKQSIYRWRGGDWNILRTMAPEALAYGGSAVDMCNLRYNFRSHTKVVRFNNVIMRLVAKAKNRELNDQLFEALESGKISKPLYTQLYDSLERAYQWDLLKQIPRRGTLRSGYVTVTAHTTEEPDFVSTIRSLVHEKHYNPCDITILVRTNDEAEQIANILLDLGAQDESMRFGIMTQEALRINSSPAVQFIFAVMKYAVDRRDVISLACYKRLGHNFDLTHKLTDAEVAFFDSIRSCSPEEAFEQIVMRYPQMFEGHSLYVEAFHEYVVKFCGGKVADLPLFVKWWDENGGKMSVNVDKDINAIEIMTIHKAKGLENKVVIIPYCNWRFIPKRPSTIWTVASKDSELGTDMLFPVKATSTVANSIFSEGYFREYVYSNIDAINVLYVALTRPKEQLHIFFPKLEPNKDGKVTIDNVGALIYQLLGMDAMIDKNATEDAPIVYRYGTDSPATKDKEQSQNTISINQVHASPYTMRVKLSSERYMEARKAGGVTPQMEGIALHGVMERARNREDIDNAVQQLVIDGVLSATQAEQLLSQIAVTLDNSLAAEWFDGAWDEVHTEDSIITPKGVKRPDRVMVVGDRAVVVDYKFGERSEDYNEQIALYCRLLSQMGYQCVEGYIWYVREGEIERVV
ncbi:MAG: UvrD-helicase domain-containing protein [Alistipes sp.]|nr:UvrD-helicase domain-containing protein [Alistipes sp.]